MDDERRSRMAVAEVTGAFGARPPRLAIGTAALAVPYGPPGAEQAPPPRSAALRTLRCALERGLRFIDTAPAYGEAEALVGLALGGYAEREECVVATKLTIPPAGWAALSSRETRAHVRASVHASLRVLGRARLDVVQIHNAQPAQMRPGALIETLAELRAEGLIGSVGATVYGEAHALAAVACAGVEVLQIAYSVLDRRSERRVLPAAAAAGTTVVARSLLLRGVLSSAARELRGPFAPLARASEAVRRAFGVEWVDLPGAAVAFAATRRGIAWALLGPRDEDELGALLDQTERLLSGAAGWQPPPGELPDWLLDPSRWPAEEATVGG
jgi:aryl-alcohol dehydrogenase-like predicted oxidoreductase